MRPRSLGRRLAVQYLFMAEVGGFDAAGPVEAFLAAQREAEGDAGVVFEGRELAKWEEAAAFARGLVGDALRDRETLDRRIAAATANWDFGRLAATDKSVLRVAAAELRRGGLARAIVIDEAVGLAKRFGTPDSGAFVNGVLTGLADADVARGADGGVPGDDP